MSLVLSTFKTHHWELCSQFIQGLPGPASLLHAPNTSSTVAWRMAGHNRHNSIAALESFVFSKWYHSCYTHAILCILPLCTLSNRFRSNRQSSAGCNAPEWAKAWPLKQVSSIAPIPATVTRQNMIIKKLDWETLAIFAINLITLIIIILNHLLSEHPSNPKQISPIAEIKFRGCVLGTNATGANARVALALASLEFLQHCNTTLESETLRQPNVLLEDMARHDAKALGLASGPKVAAKCAKWNLRRGSANWVMSWLGTLLSCIFVRDKKR